MNFRQLSVHLQYLPSSCSASAGYPVHFSCIRGTFCKLTLTFERSRNLPLTFRTSAAPSVNFCVTADMSSTFFASTQPPATSIKFPCIHWSFRDLFLWQQNLPSTFRAPQYLPSTSVNFRALTRSSVSRLRPQNLLATSVDFPCIRRIYSKLASTLHVDGGPPVNFPSYRLTFRHLSLHPRDLSNFFHFPLLLSSSSSSRVSYPELMKYSPIILIISITQLFEQFGCVELP